MGNYGGAFDGLPGFDEPTGPSSRGGRFGGAFDDLGFEPAEVSAPEEPGLVSRALHGVGSIIGAPKAGIDWLARQGARAQGLDVPDTATTGEMIRNAVGLNQGDEGYAGKLGGRAVQFAGDLATDPLTYTGLGFGSKAIRGAQAAEGLLAATGRDIAPEALSALEAAVNAGRVPAAVQRGVSGALGAGMGLSALQEGQHAYDTYRHEGFTPKVAEEALGTALSAGMAGLAGTHAAHAPFGDRAPGSEEWNGPSRYTQPLEAPERSAEPIRPEDLAEVDRLQSSGILTAEQRPAELERRAAYYEGRGMPAAAEATRAEIARRSEPIPAEPIPVEPIPEVQPILDIPEPPPGGASTPAVSDATLPPSSGLRLGVEAPVVPEGIATNPVQNLGPSTARGQDQTLPLADPVADLSAGRLDQAPSQKESPVAPSDARRYQISEKQKRTSERLASALDSFGKTADDLTEADVLRLDPRATPEEVETTLKDARRRITARIAGKDFVEHLRSKYGDVAPDDPRADSVETIPDPSGRGDYWFIQRHQGEVVGGAKSLFGIRGMVAGGEPVGSPVSARPIFEAMNGLDIQPSDAVSPYGRDAQERSAGGRVSPEAGRAGEASQAPGYEAGVPGTNQQPISAETAGEPSQADTLAGLGWTPEQIGRLDPAVLERVLANKERPAYIESPERAIPTNMGGRAAENPPQEAATQRQATLAEKQKALIEASGEANNPLFQPKAQPKYSVRPNETLAEFRKRWSDSGVDNFVGEHGDTLTLSRVVVPKGERSQGIGSKFMEELTALADADGKRLALSPSTDFGGSSKGRLADFYKRFGFVENKGRNKDFRISESMIREPRSGEPRYSAKPNEQGFFSQLRRAVDDTKQPAASGSNWISYLRDQKRGVKTEEMKWTGLDEYLQSKSGQKVTKQEIQDFLDQNEVQVKETTEGTKFKDYQLPGGENYRELLLTLPARQTPEKAQARYEKVSAERGALLDRLDDVRDTPEEAAVRRQLAATNAEYSEATRGISQEDTANNFRGGHFDEPNILAHVRFNERTDADGKRVLFLEEIQSDWAQKGRREGFASGTEGWVAEPTGAVYGGNKEYIVKDSDGKHVMSVTAGSPEAAISAAQRRGVPAAPFVGKTEAWSELAMKRMVRWAAENGFDKVAWTTGEQQAARYDLSKQVKAVYYKKNADGTYQVFAEHKTGGNSTNLGNALKESDLEGAIGKDVAARIASGQGTETNLGGGGSSQRDMWTSLSGDGLKVGGEGMKGFYDQILPAVAGKIGKKFGAKVGETSLGGRNIEAIDAEMDALHKQEMSGSDFNQRLNELQNERNAARPEFAQTVHAMDITPQMRESVMQGQPLFRATGESTVPDVSTETIRRAFAAGGVKEAGQGAWDVHLPNERIVRIRTRPDGIEYNAEAFEKGYQRPKAEGEKIVGSWQPVDRGGLMWLAKEADQGTVHHEAFHAAMDLALTAKEKAAVLSKYGSEEAAAEAYAKWEPKTANSWFSRILQFFKRTWNTLSPSWESAFSRTRSGEAYGGEASAPEAQAPKYATAPPAAGTNVPNTGMPTKNSTPADMLFEGWKSGLVSAPGTQLANPVSNLGEAGFRGIESAVAGFVDKALGGERTRYSGEAIEQMKGAMQSLPKAFDALSSGLKDVASSKGAIPGKAGQIARIPLQMLQVGDSTTAALNEGAVLRSMAYRQAKSELPGASKSAIETRQQDIIQNPSAGLKAQVEKEVQSRQFRAENDPDSMIGMLKSLRSKHPWMNVVMPFIETPGNIAKLAIQRSPVGFKKAFTEYRAYKNAIGKVTPAELAELKGNAVDAITRPLVGTTVMGLFGAYAKAGGMTGSGPTDPKQVALKKQTGWQPYSFVVPDGKGGHAYIPFNRFEPASSLLGFAADMAEMKDQKKAGDLLDKGLGSIMQNLTSKTYLQGLADAAEFINDPKRMGSQYVSGLAASVVPNIVAKAAQAYDPIQRDTSSSQTGLTGIPERILKSVEARIPGLSTTLPARRTATGKEQERPGNALTRFALPVQITADKPGTELEKLLVDIDSTPGQPSRDFTIPNSKGKKLRLTDSELSVLQDANAKAADELRKNYLNNPRFKRLDPEEQKKTVNRVLQSERDKAKERLARNPAFRRRLREATL